MAILSWKWKFWNLLVRRRRPLWCHWRPLCGFGNFEKKILNLENFQKSEANFDAERGILKSNFHRHFERDRIAINYCTNACIIPKMAARKWLTERFGPGPIMNSSGVQIHEQLTSMALSARFWQMIGKGPTMISVDVQVHKQLPSSSLLQMEVREAFKNVLAEFVR